MAFRRRVVSVFRKLTERERDTYLDPKEVLDDTDTRMVVLHLENLGGEDTHRMAFSAVSLRTLALTKAVLLLSTVCNYLQDFHEMSAKHRLHILELLPVFLKAASSLDPKQATILLNFAINDMKKMTELGKLYQVAAGDVLVALWKHSPAKVISQLLKSFQGQLLSNQNTLHILRRIANQEFLKTNFLRAEEWERKLVEIGWRTLLYLSDEVCCSILSLELRKKTLKKHALEKLFLYQLYGSVLRASSNVCLVEESLRCLLKEPQNTQPDREGIAYAVGLAASRHAECVLKVLEECSDKNMQTTDLSMESSLCNSYKTILACYGQVLCHIPEEILDRAQELVSRIIAVFETNPTDTELRSLFLEVVQNLLQNIFDAQKREKRKLDNKRHHKKYLMEINEVVHLSSILTLLSNDTDHSIRHRAKQGEQKLQCFMQKQRGLYY